MSTVEEALKAREKRKKESTQAMDDKTASAFEAYKNRKNSTVQNAQSDLAKRINAEIEAAKNASTPSWGADSFKNTMESTRANRINISDLKREVESYKGYLDDDAYNDFMDALNSLENGYSNIVESSKVFSQFDSEDAYNSWKKTEDEKNAVLGAEDFDQYSQLGANIENPPVKGAEGWMSIGDWRLGGDDVGNIVTYSRENADAIRIGEGNGSNMIGDYRYAHMTDNEVGIYNYYLAKYGEDKANEYLKSIDDELNKREAGVLAEAFDDNGFLEATFAFSAGLNQFASGIGNLDNYILGTEADPTSAMQYANAIVRENNDGVWGVVYDLINTTGNMLPSILVSTVVPGGGAIAGAATMGVSATGNAYSEMRNLGYSANQARAYATMVGVSEAGLQYALGGIGKLGGKLTGKGIKNLASTFDNAIARVAIEVGGNMASEAFEEAAQTVLESAFKSLATGEDFEAPEWGDVWYSALLGALSAGTLEGVPTIAGTAINSHNASVANGKLSLTEAGKIFLQTHDLNAVKTALQEGKKAYAENSAAYVNKSLEIDSENAHAQRMKARVDGGKSVSGYQLNRLAEANEQTIYKQDKGKIASAVSKRLTQLGEEGDVGKLSEVIAKKIAGEKLSMSEKSILKDSWYGDRVINEMTHMESGEYTSEWAEETAVELLRSNAHNQGLYDLALKMAGASFGDVNTSATKNTTEKENASEAKFEVSTDGKTTNASTGEAITINKSNAIAKTAIVDGKRVVYLNTDKGVVESTNVKYASREDGLLYEAFVDMNPAFANAVIKNYDGSVPIQTYIKGMREGMIVYGMNNFQAVGKDISKDSFLAELSEADQAFALKLGRAYAESDAKKADKPLKTAIKKASEEASKTDGSKKVKKGGVSFENGAKARNGSQRRMVSLAKHLSRAIGIDIVFYDATIKGTANSDANGWYDEETDTIHLDLQNSSNDAKTIAFTLSHELMHFIKKRSATQFNTFAKFLMEQYAEHGVNTSDLLKNKMAQLNTSDVNFAYEEMICDACETLLLDSNATIKLMELRKTDLNLFETIKLHILELLNKIRAEYRRLGLKPTSDEAKSLLKMEDVLDQIYAKFEEALVVATQNYQASQVLNNEAVSISKDGTVKLQMKQYEQTGRATLLNYLKEKYGDNNANDLILTIDSIYNTLADVKKDTALSVFGNWQDTEVELDKNGHPIFTTSINNGDYELNQDFSRVCKKRRQLNFVLNMLAEDPAFEASNLTKEDFVKINKAIKKHGFEIACALCFVDSKRFRQSEWADSFANTWNDIISSMKADNAPLSRFNFATKSVNMNDDGIKIDTSKPISFRKWSDGKVSETRTYKNLDDLLKREGNANVKKIATLIRDNPNLRHEFRGADIIASDGFDSIQRLAPDVRGILDGWGGTSVPKPSSNDAIYDNSVLNIAGYNEKKAFSVGGVRMNSFSDFMAHMFFDYAQAFADLSAKELPMHSYTKELDFARLFGLTGGKINMSAIAAIRNNATDLDKIKRKADKEKATAFEKSIAGLDISRLADKLGKAESEITYDDVIENLDDVDYVWADESIDVKNATLLQSGILYDNLTEGQATYCYELIREGKFAEAFAVAGEANVNKGYAKHLGIIAVGVSKAHILKLMRDPTIRMVIPYHKSGLNATIAKALKIAFYDDFTDVQNTMVQQNGKQVGITKDGAKVNGKTLKDFSFYDWFGKTIDGVFYDGKATASKYLEWSKSGLYDESVGDYVYYFKNGEYILASELHAQGIEIIPKFSEFASEENYYKLIEDFDCYDTITGEHSSQEAVDLFHNGLPSDYKDVLVRALKAEQKVHDDFRYHLDNKGLRDEIMDIVKPHGYTPSENGIKKQAKPTKGNVYDYTKSFAQQIDDYKNGLIPQRDTLLVSGTPDVWKKVGFTALPVTINQTHVDYALNGTKDIDHHIGETLLKDLPNAIQNPVAIIQSQSPNNKDRAVVILKMRHNGKNVIGAIEVDGFGVTNSIRIDSNAMASVLAKSNALAQLNNAINNTVNGKVELFYWNKKEAITLLQSAGHQLSGSLPQDGFVHSIHDNGSNVKTKFKNITETQQFKRWFGDWQNNPKKASKVVNDDGTPMVVYHGSSVRGIEVFQTTNASGTGGLYLSTNSKVAEGFAGKDGEVYEVYVNIRKPFVVDANNAYYDSIAVPSEMKGSKYTFGGTTVDTNAIAAYARENNYDGVIIKNVRESTGFCDDIIAFEREQIKSATDNIGTFDPNNANIHYQEKKISDRTILANALESVAQNDIEKNKLNEYKRKISLIESEQAKLVELRAKIKELSFAKGARDTEAIKSLQFEANQTANRINTYDKQLLNLESTKALKNVLQREKQMAYKRAEQKGKDALAAYREKATKTQRELMTRYQESRKKGIDSRHKVAMRHKIKDVVSELNQYLLKGTKDKHVPIQLQKAVAEALDAVNMDTVGAEERIAKLQAELMKAKTPEAIQSISRKIDRVKEMGDRMDGKLQALKNAYDEIVNSDDPLIANSHDEVISNSIAKVITEVGSTPLRDMSLAQLESVYDMYKMVLTTIRNTNKAFKAAKSEEISVIANRVMEEIDKLGKKKAYRRKASQTASKFDWNNLKPVYAFERIGSNTFTEVFNNVRAGEDTWAVDVTEAKEFSKEQRKKFKYDSWDFNKRYAFTSSLGQNFELSLDQIMSLYAYSKRGKQAKDHLKYGGFQFDGITEVKKKTNAGVTVTYQLDDPTAYKISDELLDKIIGKLNEEQRAFADAMQDYLSTTMGEKGNEVSLALYDVKLFKEKNYFPLRVSHDFLARAREQAQGDVKIKNKGFTKETDPNAKNPIVLTPFMDVWADHVNEMSMYHAFTLPLEDFYRVYNYGTPSVENMDTMSVVSSLRGAHRDGATQYIDQLLKDLNGGARVDSTVGVINKMTGVFKKSAVFGSLSVVIQQPSAIARAWAIIDAKYFVGKPSKTKHKETWAEVKKYAPVAIIKEMGYFDTGMGQSTVDWIKDKNTWKDKVDDAVSKAPALADELAWCAIWKAVKRETLHTHKNLKPNSDEFLKAVGARFTEVITKTQVYDSVLARSAHMRSKDTGMKMATAFMAEPTTSINMIENAITQLKRGDKRYARKAIGSVVASMILNSILVSFVYAGRDDDEEKTYVEKYVGTLTEELLDSINPLTLIPFAKDIVSIMQGYDVERSDMAVITDLINAWNNLDSDNRSVYRKVEDFAGAIASIFGLPVKNIMRDARGIYNTVNSFINGEQTTGAGIHTAIVEAVTGDEKSNGQQLYEAMLDGDSAQIERVKGRFKDQKAINSAIRTALRDNEPRIKEAAEARYNGDIAEYMRVAKSIIAEGYFKQDDIVAAINSEITALKKNDGKSESSESSDKVKSIYEVSDYYTAIVGRDQATAYVVKEDLIKTDVANGKDRDEAEADFNSKFVSHLKDLHEKGELSDYDAENMLVNYGGKTYEQASAKVQYWNFKEMYPDYDLSEEAVTKYYEEVEPYGINISVYYDYTKSRAKCKGVDLNADGKTDSGSVKSQVMEVIDSLPISDSQKDALYYLNGWSANTIYEAPWH